jgi:hypothetical protein
MRGEERSDAWMREEAGEGKEQAFATQKVAQSLPLDASTDARGARVIRPGKGGRGRRYGPGGGRSNVTRGGPSKAKRARGGDGGRGEGRKEA